MMLAVIGGGPLRFAPFVDLYHRALAQFQLPTQPVGMHSPAHIAETDELAQEQLWPHYRAMMDRIGRERGWSPMTRGHFEQEAGPEGALFVGSPETVARKVATAVDGLGLSRVDLKISNGSLSHEHLMDSIGLYGSEVVPRVRELLAGTAAA
jgi:alkanesulfonate monooxygenase SsuD/methylene tetrahydromethanopterin reductase-like flavin-dependent oxidoreductase (luciferase family)